MNISSIGNLTAGQQKADTVEPTAEQRKAARDFEAIFLRQMLSGLEKSSGLAGSGKSSGAEIFGSMMVGALADTAAEGGGIGLSELILKAMLPPTAQAKPDLTGAGTSRAGAPQDATLRGASPAALEPAHTVALTEPRSGPMVEVPAEVAHDDVRDRSMQGAGTLRGRNHP